MKFSPTKLVIALMAISASGVTLAQGVNFSNLSSGTVLNTTISQTGAGFGRISNGENLTYVQGDPVTGTDARGVTFTRGALNTGALLHEGTLKTISLTQVSTVARTGTQENAIRGSLYTTDGAGTDGTGFLTVLQAGLGNVVDVNIGASGAALASPKITITQKGEDNQTELTRTGGTNTDTIASYGNSNTVSVTGSATGTNSVALTFGSDGGTASSSNQATISQTGSNQNFTAQVTGSSNVLDVGQSGATQIFTTVSGFGLNDITGSTNYLFVRQSNATNTAAIAINGSTNKVDVTQSGTTGVARLALTGSGNDIGITQSSSANSALITLAATSATMLVAQSTPSASYTFVGTIPSGGSISVTQ